MAATMMDVERKAQHAGWLAKRAVKSGRSWKNRWFELHDNIFSYYKKNTGTRPRGVLTLTYDSTIKAVAVDDEHPFCFEVERRAVHTLLRTARTAPAPRTRAPVRRLPRFSSQWATGR